MSKGTDTKNVAATQAPSRSGAVKTASSTEKSASKSTVSDTNKSGQRV